MTINSKVQEEIDRTEDKREELVAQLDQVITRQVEMALDYWSDFERLDCHKYELLLWEEDDLRSEISAIDKYVTSL